MKISITYLIIPILTLFFRVNKPVIEIYLLKSRLPGYGYADWGRLSRPFVADRKDLQDKPFIQDAEILSYDTVKYKLRFSESAAQKISGLQPDLLEGIQFALTINKEPVLTGYFINFLTSQGTLSYTIDNRYDTVKNIGRWLPGDTTDIRKNAVLVNSFIQSERIR